MEIELIKLGVKKLRLKPDDVLVFEPRTSLTKHQPACIQQMLHDIFPNNKIILLDGLSLKVINAREMRLYMISCKP